MRHVPIGVFVVFFLGGQAVRGDGPDKPDAAPYGGCLVLIGAADAKSSDVFTIQTMAPDGSGRKVRYRVEGKGAIPSGRVSPAGDRVAFTINRPDSQEQELWLLDQKGGARQLADRAGWVTAWSPDGKHISYYRIVPPARKDDPEVFESLVFDLTSGKESKLDTPVDYFVEDWHPKARTFAVTYQNPRNAIYRVEQRDAYPVRQTDVWTPGHRPVPISKDPSHDNLNPRFSPTGDRIAAYRRRFVDGKPREYFVVYASDGSKGREVFAFTDTGDAEKRY